MFIIENWMTGFGGFMIYSLYYLLNCTYYKTKPINIKGKTKYLYQELPLGRILGDQEKPQAFHGSEVFENVGEQRRWVDLGGRGEQPFREKQIS